jgi:ubiquinone/menaquinone biosynthesis C-methylase UbiE
VSRAPWWRSYFDDDFYQLHESFFPERRNRREVAGMIELLALPIGARVLDAPCGWGRHTALLADAGYAACGADLSYGLLRRAPRQATGCYAACDIRALPFRDASFDAVINVFTSLGLFLNDDDDLAALREARRVLRSGGAMLLETMHRDDVMRSYAERDAWTLPDGTQVRVRRRFDAVAGVSHERLRWKRGSAHGRKAHALRLRTATEIDALLRAAGFQRIRHYGGWNGRAFTHRQESLIAVASV